MRISLSLERPEFESPVIAAGKLLKPLGVEVVAGIDPTADFQIIGNQLFLSLEATGDLRLKPPFGIWERADQEVVSPLNRDLLRRPEISVWFKDFLIRDPNLNNAPLVDGYFHYRLLSSEKEKTAAVPEIILGPSELAKIQSINSLPSYDLIATWRDMTPLLPEDRDIDVLFSATMTYPDDLVREHRLNALRAMHQIRDRVTLAATGRALSNGAYFDTIARSKIVISPWSMGMASLKDWEAMFAGCVLIKPDCSLLKSYHPDIFANERNYVACRTDFSDLKDLVDKILENYSDYYGRAQSARQQLLQCRDRAPIARDLYMIVITALGRAPDPRLDDILAEAPPELRWIPEGLSYFSRSNRLREPQSHYRTSINLLNGGGFIENWMQLACSLTPDSPINDVPGKHPAVRMSEDRTPNQSHEILQRFSVAENTTSYAFSFLARAEERTSLWIWLGVREFDDHVQALFDLEAGSVASFSQVGHSVTPLRVGMIPITNGWWWCWLSAEFDGTSNSGGVAISLANDIRIRRYGGDGHSGVSIALPRIERGERALLEM